MLLSNLNLLATAPGGVTRLRELILTLAVQGKLVPQDTSDEPASKLLKKIRAEKDRLIAVGKIKRDKPLEEIDEAETPFGLPESWELVKLNELLPEFQNGASSRGDVGGKSVTVLRLADIKNRRISLADTRQIPITERDILKYHLHVGDILITRVNGSADIVGQFNLCEVAIDAIYCDHFIRMRVSRQWIEPTYLALISESSLMRGRIKELFITTAGQKTVNQGHIGSLQFGLPPLAEQSRIVTRVEELMRLCDALEAKGQLEATQHAQLVSTLLATLTDSETPEQLTENWHRIATHFDLLIDRPQAVDALEQTILQLAVRGLLVHQDPQDEPAWQLVQRLSKESLGESSSTRRDIEVPFVIPNSWCWVRLENLAKSMSNGLYKPAKFYSQTGTACVRMYNIQDGHLDFFKLMRLDVTPSELAQYSLEPGDLLINRVNSRELVGKCAVVSGHPEPLVYEAMNIRVRLLELANMPSYVNLVLRTRRVREVFQGDAKQAVGQASINQTQVGGVAIPLPPLAEQSRIVTRVAQLRRLCFELRQCLTASQSTQAHLAEALVLEGI
jgi:type I restriction enzyme, S subunit